MRRMRWATWVTALALVGMGSARPAAGDVTTDQAAAILNFPFVDVELGDEGLDLYVDTIIQISNTSDRAVDVHCFWENANPHCTNTGEICYDAADCCSESSCGICLPGWNETDFHFRVTPRQPLAWRASEGLTKFPLTGIGSSRGPDGSSNAGSRIPPVPEDPFLGLLKCIAVDPQTGLPTDRNVLKGEATLEFFFEESEFPIDVAKYNAVGIKAHPGAMDENPKLLQLGPGFEGEYNGCPSVTILNHFFDLAVDPVNQRVHLTLLVLAPCSQNLLQQIPGGAVVQYLVYNEFEQRFSTSRGFQCQQVLPLSSIDTTDPTRSIFSAGVAGTVTGQTRLQSVAGSGVLAVADELYLIPVEEELIPEYSAAFNVHHQGYRAEPDFILLP